jgi:hypothetical protein
MQVKKVTHKKVSTVKKVTPKKVSTVKKVTPKKVSTIKKVTPKKVSTTKKVTPKKVSTTKKVTPKKVSTTKKVTPKKVSTKPKSTYQTIKDTKKRNKIIGYSLLGASLAGLAYFGLRKNKDAQKSVQKISKTAEIPEQKTTTIIENGIKNNISLPAIVEQINELSPTSLTTSQKEEIKEEIKIITNSIPPAPPLPPLQSQTRSSKFPTVQTNETSSKSTINQYQGGSSHILKQQTNSTPQSQKTNKFDTLVPMPFGGSSPNSSRLHFLTPNFQSPHLGKTSPTNTNYQTISDSDSGDSDEEVGDKSPPSNSSTASSRRSSVYHTAQSSPISSTASSVYHTAQSSPISSTTSSPKRPFLEQIAGGFNFLTSNSNPNKEDIKLILKECDTLVKSCIENLSNKEKKLSKEFKIDKKLIEYIIENMDDDDKKALTLRRGYKGYVEEDDEW